jgi:hypothetical protein
VFGFTILPISWPFLKSAGERVQKMPSHASLDRRPPVEVVVDAGATRDRYVHCLITSILVPEEFPE